MWPWVQNSGTTPVPAELVAVTPWSYLPVPVLHATHASPDHTLPAPQAQCTLLQ